MKKLNTVDCILYTESLTDQISEIHVCRTLSRADKHKALVELGLKPWDLKMLYNGLYFNPTTPIRVVTPRGETYTFGVEIECFVPRYQMQTAATNNGVAIQYEGYNHNDTKDHYKFVTDSSVRSSNRDEDRNSIECVSPILKGKAGLLSLKKACKALNEAGATVNKSCGLHVHIGADKMSTTQYVNIFKNYQKIESLIDSFMAPSRRNNSYCRYIGGLRFEGCTTHNDVLNACFRDRYYKVNACAYSRHKTVEFRQHQGTTNYEKISMWVNFLVKLVEWSKDNVFDTCPATINDIPFLSDKEKAYFTSRASELN